MTKIQNDLIAYEVIKWLDNGHSWSELSNKLNWTKSNGQEDVTRIKRCLGLTKEKQRYISDKIALDILLAIDVEHPGDYGI
jgi:hypothetical protein